MRAHTLVRTTLLISAICFAIAFAALPASATFPGKNGLIVFVANPSGSWQLYSATNYSRVPGRMPGRHLAQW